MLNINDRAGAQAPQELPPVHPECKVVFKFQVVAGVKALRDRGEFLEAQKLEDALLRVCPVGPHHRQ
jgi:hypothetical protein